MRLDATRIEVADVAPAITVDDEDDLETGVIVAAEEMPTMHTVSPCEEAPSKIRSKEPTTYSPEEPPEDSPEETPPGASHFTRDAAYNSTYDTYTCVVDRSQDDKSLEFHPYSFKRPHMRAFHFACVFSGRFELVPSVHRSGWVRLCILSILDAVKHIYC